MESHDCFPTLDCFTVEECPSDPCWTTVTGYMECPDTD
jgi:hypothetical protein